MINLRFANLHEIVENELSAAINIPGLGHITTRAEDTADGGKIDFLIMRQPCGVVLHITSAGEYSLTNPDEPKAVSWTAEEAQPETITAAVIEALRARVRAAA